MTQKAIYLYLNLTIGKTFGNTREILWKIHTLDLTKSGNIRENENPKGLGSKIGQYLDERGTLGAGRRRDVRFSDVLTLMTSDRAEILRARCGQLSPAACQ